MPHADWNGEVYHRISEPQFAWGQAVLETLPLAGDEVVLDAGCGSGRLTALLCARLPRGHVVAFDASASMLEAAKAALASFGPRVSFVHGDLGALVLPRQVDVVFSTATFHWVLDHRALFAGLARALRPSGRLHAQCGGAGNLKAFNALAARVAQAPRFRSQLSGFESPTFFAGVDDSRARLSDAGFVALDVTLVDAPTRFATAAAYREFIEHVILRHHLVRLAEADRGAFLDAVVEAAAGQWSLDYVRLNLRATRGP
ncbi:MAG: methyltransferase domain-containing protein [Myxococcaceae bacterium]|nr:methyltransferase domain-containing protein [Myxococcaceae bacterium]